MREATMLEGILMFFCIGIMWQLFVLYLLYKFRDIKYNWREILLITAVVAVVAIGGGFLRFL